MSWKTLCVLLLCIPLTWAQESLGELPGVISVADGTFTWGQDGVPVIGRERDAMIVTVAGQSIHVDLQAARQELVKHTDLQALVERAQPPLRAPERGRIVLSHSPMLGIYLATPQRLITSQDVLPATDAGAPRDHRRARETVIAQRDRLLARVPEMVPQELVQPTVVSLLRRSLDDLEDPDRRYDIDEISPVFARRVLRHDVLAQISPRPQVAVPFVEALRDAERPHLTYAYVADGRRVEIYVNAFDRDVLVLRDGNRARVQMPTRPPAMHDGAARHLAGTWTVIDLPHDHDIQAPLVLERVQAAGLYHRGRRIVDWQAPDQFTWQQRDWANLIPRIRDAVPNHVPANIVLTDAFGDIHALVTRHGLLRAPTGHEDDVERFISEAAERLPDAAHLDLIGQYFFQYVFDSPDSTVPVALGTREHKSDIHQTAAQTLASATGGVCRGDCDDIAELYQAIAERQGRLAHVIIVPGHAALAWADERDGHWYTTLLQTGPAYQFRGETLAESLRRTYTRFDETDNFDHNAVGLLLRFSGENMRSAWRLSSRIFSEPEYAETMIDVQKDWHYQTYLQCIKKMEAMIAAGDHDTANYRELAGLDVFTGQYLSAAKHLEEAIKRTDEKTARIGLYIEKAMHLFSADEDEQASAIIRDLLERRLPAAQEELGMGMIQVGWQIAGTCLRGNQTTLGAQALAMTTFNTVARVMPMLQDFITNRFDGAAWMHSSQLNTLRRIARRSAHLALALLDRASPEEREGDVSLQNCRRLAEQYLQHIAFHDVNDASGIPRQYAMLARLLRIDMGDEEFARRLAAATVPEAERNHTDRSQADIDTDLSWIAMSIPYWVNELMDAFDRRHEALDRDHILAIGKRLDPALEATRRFGMAGTYTFHSYHLGRLIVALVAEDEATIRELMQHVQAQDDKRLRDDTAEWIGNCARFLPMPWFKRVLELWREEVDYKAKYLWIAWRAAINKAPEHALVTARFTAERFPDNEAFAAEERFMRQLFAED